MSQHARSCSTGRGPGDYLQCMDRAMTPVSERSSQPQAFTDRRSGHACKR